MKVAILVFLILVVMTTVTMIECTRAKDGGAGPVTTGRNRGETQKMRKKAGRERKIEKNRLKRHSLSGHGKTTE